METNLKPFIDAVIEEGKSVVSQAAAAKVHAESLRRLIRKDPRYQAAVAAGKIETRIHASPLELQKSPLVQAVVRGQMSVKEATVAFGVAEMTVRDRVKKAFPEFKFGRSSRDNAQFFRGDDAPASSEQHHAPVPGLSPAGPIPTAGVLPVITWEIAKLWDPSMGPVPTTADTKWMASPVESSPHSYVLEVFDNAMTAPGGARVTFPAGIKIFVDCNTVYQPSEGDFVLARLASTGDLVFRIYHKVGATEFLEALNPVFPAVNEGFKVIGRVFGKWEDLF